MLSSGGSLVVDQRHQTLLFVDYYGRIEVLGDEVDRVVRYYVLNSPEAILKQHKSHSESFCHPIKQQLLPDKAR